jgi:hypothetical protein
MKTTTLFQLGGIAFLGAALLYGVANLSYFLAGQPDAPTALGLWLSILGGALSVFGWGALFARQAQRGGVLGLAGYVLLVVGEVYFIASAAVGLGVAAGALTNDQIAQVAAYTAANTSLPWAWTAGLILLGISIYRAQVLPKFAGALLVLFAVVQQLTGPLAFTRPIFALLSFAAWAWLGWILLTDPRTAAQAATPNHRGTTYSAAP